MNEKKKNERRDVMKKNDVWKRARRIPVMLITEGLCVGLVGGFVVLLYRVALTFA